MTDAPDPLAVACPTCGAPPGEPCGREPGEDEVHLARQTLVERGPPGI